MLPFGQSLVAGVVPGYCRRSVCTRQSWIWFTSFALSLASNMALAQPVYQPFSKNISPDFIGAEEPTTDLAIYGQGVRETDWRTPEQEREGFHLPPGFQNELFASEPEISKPLNMAWDHLGRLWVTCTTHYPYPVPDGEMATDTIKVLEDTDNDGHADKVTTFADDLNIPMGLLPVSDGVICFSIPNLWRLTDTDGDGRCDERTKLLGPFDTSRDTHGMVNSLRRGQDGWIYACHGFNNISEVTSTDGSSVRLQSGNVFRFKEDGSSIELFTQGQVNPFGLTQDEYGNWYSADCHSKPITALLPGACYPSFGRPDDGLGFAPAMMEHLNGSTAISGLLYNSSNHFSMAYRGVFYSGNVMTSRLNANRLVWHGATARAEALPDFLTSDDPWFRPVDIQMGPDGAMYVADFYNKIIGHYEVPLEHPGRDRTSGRIWRITYDGERQHDPVLPLKIGTQEAPSLKRANATRRRASIEAQVLDPRELRPSLETSVETYSDYSALEVLFRRGELDDELLTKLRYKSYSRTVALRMSSGMPAERAKALLPLARRAFDLWEFSPHMLIAALPVIGRLGNGDDAFAALKLIELFHDRDPALAHAARIAIRNLLKNEAHLKSFVHLVGQDERVLQNPIVARELAIILPAVGSKTAEDALIAYSVRLSPAHEDVSEAALRILLNRLPTVARAFPNSPTQAGLSSTLVDYTIRLVEGHGGSDGTAKTERLLRVCAVLAVHEIPVPELLAELANDLARETILPALLENDSPAPPLWIDRMGEEWQQEIRVSDRGEPLSLVSSLTRGEQYTGTATSEVFSCPSELQFYVAGHNGPPAKPDLRQNQVQLLDAQSGVVLKSVFPPRSDVAKKVSWDCSAFESKRVQLAIVDGDAGNAYAWIAIGQCRDDRAPIASLQPWSEAGRIAWQQLARLVESGAFGPSLPSFVKVGRSEDGIPSQPPMSCAVALLIANHAQANGRQLVAQLCRAAVSLGRADLVSLPLAKSHEPSPTRDESELANALCSKATIDEQRRIRDALFSSIAGFQLAGALLESGALSGSTMRSADASQLPESLPERTRTILQNAITRAHSSAAANDALDERLDGLDWSKGNIQLGNRLFTKHCAICHQLAGEGKLVGPQLDGAAARSNARLLEDVMRPNSNLDAAFRTTTLLLDDDTIVSGLVSDTDSGTIRLTKQDGTVENFPPERVISRKLSTKSLMPENFSELLSDQDLVALITYIQNAARK